MPVNLHKTDWVATQWEDPVLKAMTDWILNWKVQDLKHLLGDNANTEEGMAILQEWKNWRSTKEPYHHHTQASKLEEVVQFIVPMGHQVTAMYGCHRDVRQQGQQKMLYLLQDQFWWPGMAMQMQKVISNCKQCIQHGGNYAKPPMQPIIATSLLDLLHIDFMSIEMTMEVDQPPNMVSILDFCDHFTKHTMAYMTPDQTVKAVARFLWQGYISIFRAPAKLLSDQGANLKVTSSNSYVNSWAYGRLGLHLTTLKPTDK